MTAEYWKLKQEEVKCPACGQWHYVRELNDHEPFCNETCAAQLVGTEFAESIRIWNIAFRMLAEHLHSSQGQLTSVQAAFLISAWQMRIINDIQLEKVEGLNAQLSFHKFNIVSKKII